MMKLAVLTTLVGSATAFAPVAFKVRHEITELCH